MADTKEREECSNASRAGNASRLLTDSLLLSLIPAVAYFLAYKYEQGICDYFSLPLEIMDPSLWSVVGFSLALIGGASFVAIQLNAWATIGLNTPVRRFWDRLHQSIRLRWLLLAAFLVACFSIGSRQGIIVCICIIAIVAILDIVIPLLRRGTKARITAINDAEEAEIQSVTRPIEYLPRRLLWLPLAIIATPIVLHCAYLAGESRASRTTVFPCIDLDSRQYAVLRIYHDVAYCAEVDSQEKEITGCYRAMPLAQHSWQMRAIGPLARPQKATPFPQSSRVPAL